MRRAEVTRFHLCSDLDLPKTIRFFMGNQRRRRVPTHTATVENKYCDILFCRSRRALRNVSSVIAIAVDSAKIGSSEVRGSPTYLPNPCRPFPPSPPSKKELLIRHEHVVSKRTRCQDLQKTWKTMRPNGPTLHLGD